MRNERKRCGRGLRRPGRARRATSWALLGAFLGTLPGAPAAIAAPEGERVVKGKARFERDGTHTRIVTKTRETIVDYDRFDVGADESVRIDQPTSKSRILNRVPQGAESRIDGELSSNGIVYILNPAGVFFGDRAVVDVSQLVAGAGALSNRDFVRGVDRITDVTGDVGVAAGAQIRSLNDVLLVGQHVENQGAIASERGMVALVAGGNLLLTRHGGHVLVHVDTAGEPAAASPDFALTQAGSVQAQWVTLAAGDAYSLAMNHTGITRADEIHVDAGGDALVQLAGTLDASSAAPGERGGRIEVEAGRIAVQDATLDASGAAGGGEILVGGDVRGGGELDTARRVYVDADSKLLADATAAGDGGKIIVYADEQTSFYGELSARGGAQGGDGGFAEISGANLDARGEIDLGAPQGKSGTLLYDPDTIEIRGGSADGSDSPNDSPNEVSQTRLGQVLASNQGDEGEGQPFVIYESEIEKTDANIVLEATNRIEVAQDGSFDHTGDTATPEGPGVVVIMPGNSLTIRTTGTAVPAGTDPNDENALGIDLTRNAVHGDDLTWRVSEGGNITLETRLATIDVPNNQPLPASPKASIKVGRLESTSARFQSFDTSNVDLPQDRTISVLAQRGDIEVRQITANGEDAAPPPPDDSDPEKGRSAGNGATVRITATQGDIEIGADAFSNAIEAKGGSGSDAAHSPGANGAEVTIGTEGGNLTVLGGIDVSGGDGRGSIFFDNPANPDQPLPFSGGGVGGAIGLAATGTRDDQGAVEVLADLTAKGGRGLAVVGKDGKIEEAQGGLGGAVAISAQKSIDIGAPGPGRVTFDASGGDGSGGGGSARGEFAELTADVPGASFTQSFRLTGPVADNGQTLGVTSGAVVIHGDLIAKGGKARQATGSEPGIAAADLTGGAGGRGGDALVLPDSLDARDMLLDLSGGEGDLATVKGGIDPPRDSNGTVFPVGGNGGSFSVVAAKGIDIGDTTTDPTQCCGVIARGGAATNGAGGAGGTVALTAGDPSAKSGDTDTTNDPDPNAVIVVGDIDVSGGDATHANPASKIPLAGGPGGRVTLDAREAEVGRLLLRGRVGGDGGTGVDAKGVDAHAAGATLNLTAASAIQVERNANLANVVLSGGNLALDAPEIGTRDDDDETTELVPVPIAGTKRTEAEGEKVPNFQPDVANVVADDQLALELRTENGLPIQSGATGSDALETLEVTLRKETGSALVTRGGSSETMLESVGAVGSNTLTRLQTQDGDPFLAYRLDVDVEQNDTQPSLAIARGAIDLGKSGGQVANGAVLESDEVIATNRGAIVAVDGTGSGPHGRSDGSLRLEGSSIGMGAALEFEGGTDVADDDFRPILRLDAQGAVNAKVNAPFSALEIVQNDAGARSDVALSGAGDVIDIGPDPDALEDEPTSIVNKAITTASHTAFSYRLEARPPDRSVDEARLKIREVNLGGTGLLTSRGDVLLLDNGATPAIQTNGNKLSLASNAGRIQQESASNVSIDMGAQLSDDATRDLVLIADDDIGAADKKLRTQGVDRLAGQAAFGNFVLENTGSNDGLRIQRLTPEDPGLRNPTSAASTITGILAGQESGPGGIDLTNVGSRIVLGEVTNGTAFSVAQLQAEDDVVVRAQDGAGNLLPIEIENARFLKVNEPVVGPVFQRLNDARIVAGGDVELHGPVRTSLDSEAKVVVPEGEDPDPDAPDPEFVHASLRIEARGNTEFHGNVGGDVGSDEHYKLASLDTTQASAEGEGRQHVFRVGEAHFRGALDGPAQVLVDVQDVSTLQVPADEHVAGVTFDGNLGARDALGSLDVNAEQIRFTSADRIVADGDVHLDSNPSDAPAPAATISDTNGGLSIQTRGAFTTGVNDKLSVQGPLAIQAASVTVGDLNAARSLDIASPDINIRARPPGELMLRDGKIRVDANDVPILDSGTDLVADSMSFSSVPEIVQPSASDDFPVRLGVGGGGVSAPGRLSAFDVRRFTDDVQQVTANDMQGPNGQVLDLEATGGVIVGNPSEDMPRERAITDPLLAPRFSREEPAPPPAVDSEQVLAFLRCGEVSGSVSACDAADGEQLAAVSDWTDSALGTPRAGQLAQSYREMRASDLSAVFDRAGAGFRQQWGFGEFDAAAFARYIERSGEHPEARAAIHQLANLMVEIDLLGLAPEDETRVRRELASELSAEADLPGFDTDAVLDAVAATPIELPE